MKTYFIPGYKWPSDKESYPALMGYDFEFIPIKWERRTINDYVAQVLEVIQKEDQPFALAGFSFGAVTAMIVATKIKPERLLLCSVSPYFQEDQAEKWHDPKLFNKA